MAQKSRICLTRKTKPQRYRNKKQPEARIRHKTLPKVELKSPERKEANMPRQWKSKISTVHEKAIQIQHTTLNVKRSTALTTTGWC